MKHLYVNRMLIFLFPPLILPSFCLSAACALMEMVEKTNGEIVLQSQAACSLSNCTFPYFYHALSFHFISFLKISGMDRFDGWMCESRLFFAALIPMNSTKVHCSLHENGGQTARLYWKKYFFFARVLTWNIFYSGHMLRIGSFGCREKTQEHTLR